MRLGQTGISHLLIALFKVRENHTSYISKDKLSFGVIYTIKSCLFYGIYFKKIKEKEKEISFLAKLVLILERFGMHPFP